MSTLIRGKVARVLNEREVAINAITTVCCRSLSVRVRCGGSLRLNRVGCGADGMLKLLPSLIDDAKTLAKILSESGFSRLKDCLDSSQSLPDTPDVMMTERIDLPDRYRRLLEEILRTHSPGVEVWAYGSRINGRSHAGSDLDLCCWGGIQNPYRLTSSGM